MTGVYEIGKFIGCIAGIVTECVAVYAIIKAFIIKKNKSDDAVEYIPELVKNVSALTKKVDAIDGSVQDIKRKIKNIDEQLKDDVELTLSLARERLLIVLTRVLEDEAWASVVEYRVISKLYDSYVANGGNSEIVAMYVRCKELPIKEK